jgi:uncharacterized protein (DUF427 family)
MRLKDPFGKGISDHWVHAEESPKRVRVIFGGETIADSRRPILLREAGCLPVYYFPQEDVRMELMVRNDHRTTCPYKGEASYWAVLAGGKTAENAAWSYLSPSPECSEIKGYLAFEWEKMESWYEEEEEVFRHPRDPYKRVDVLHSSRHVLIVIDGQPVAETRRPCLVFETGHPVRYYIPRKDVRMELFERSATSSRCPYKGIASYWSVRIGDRVFKDNVWSYEETTLECPKIKGLLCFFQERAAVISVDGEPVARPKTKWAEDPAV